MGDPKKLLVIDDDESNRVTLSLLLEEEGFEVHEASSFAEAKSKLGAAPFDVVLLDQHLGDGLGTDLVPECRKALPQAKLILISGSIDHRDRPDGEFDAYVPKGLAFPELLGHVKAVMR